MTRKIWAFWTTDNPMSENRLRGLESMRKNFGVPVEFLDPKGIEDAAKAIGVPLHPAYKYLSGNHKSDYLRCYFLHHVGGGYADVKVYSEDNNWAETFDLMEQKSETWVAGEPAAAQDVAFRNWLRPVALGRLTSVAWIVARPGTPFSAKWWQLVNACLDGAIIELQRHPARAARDLHEAASGYPLAWPAVGSRTFHLAEFSACPVRRQLRTLASGWTRSKTDYL